jgi:hypothetical protein
MATKERSKAHRLGVEAANTAKRQLIEAHKDEFEQLTRLARVELGLAPDKAKTLSLDEKILKKQKELNALVAQREAETATE